MVLPCSDRIARVPPYSNSHTLSTRTGLSPTIARLSILFRFLHTRHWPNPRSLATTSGVSVDVLSSGYLDVSVPRVCFHHTMNSCEDPAEARGCPIRKFTDQSLFAAPRSLSQRTTSFIASQCQGIHQMPLSRLIALIINAHLGRCRTSARNPADGHRRKTILCIRFACLWAVKRHNPRLAGKYRQIPSFTMSISNTHRLRGRNWSRSPAGCRYCHNGALRLDGGARRDRTDDLKLAKLALSQLSYGPGQAYPPDGRASAAQPIHGGPGKS